MGSFESKTSHDYRAALEGVAFFPQPGVGCLRLGDQDHRDFLQRQTTNELRGLTPERSALTVLVSPTARILDVLRVVQAGDDILALTLPGHSAPTFQYLQRRVFFNDQVRLEDASPEFSQFDLEGPALEGALQVLGFEHSPEQDEVLVADWADIPLSAIGQRGLAGLGVRLLVPAEAAEGIEQALLASEAVKLGHKSYEILRVEAGLPASPAELNENYTPLEVGLQHAVSGDKGCYPGQEVIARQITYDKVTRKLVGLMLKAPVQAGSSLLVDGVPAGEITSAVVSPRFGPISLGVVKRPHFDAGTRLEVAGETSLEALVIELPNWTPLNNQL